MHLATGDPSSLDAEAALRQHIPQGFPQSVEN